MDAMDAAQRRAFMLGQFTGGTGACTKPEHATTTTRLTQFAGPSLEFGDAPTTVVGGSWQSQFARTVERTLWTVEDERAACAQFDVASLHDLLGKCWVHVVRSVETPYIEVLAPSVQMAKVLASSLIKVKVMNLEPSDSQDMGRVMLSELRLGHNTTIVRCALNPDKTINSEFLVTETNMPPPECQQSVLAFRATIHTSKIGYMKVETIVFPKLEVMDSV